MDLSAIIKAVTMPRNERGGQISLDLQPGDKLTGRVLQLENDGRVLIDIGGPRILAQVGFAVKQGQTLKLTVVESGPRLHMRSDQWPVPRKLPLAEQANPATALKAGERRELIQILQRIIPRLEARSASGGMPEPVVNALRQLQLLFDPLPMEKPAADIAQWLRNNFENHGSLFEKRLADSQIGAPALRQEVSPVTDREPEALVRAIISRDVKSQLIVLRQALVGSDDAKPLAGIISGEETALLRTNVEKMLKHVEVRQDRAVTRSRDGEPMQLFQHLLSLADGQPPVRLKLYCPRKDRREGADTSHHIALLLDMDHLGLVRGDIAKLKDVLQVQFFVQDETVRKHFLTKQAEIVTALASCFDQVHVEVSVSREKIARFHEEDVQGDAPGRIDLKA